MQRGLRDSEGRTGDRRGRPAGTSGAGQRAFGEVPVSHGRSSRFHDLDALRAVAMYLGVVLHTGIFVLPDRVFQLPDHVFYYTIRDHAVGDDPFYMVLLDAIHGFRMPVFFILSGFFSALLWQRRGLRSLGMQRLRRVGIPFVAGCLTVVPLATWLLSLGPESQRDIPLWAYPVIWLFHLAHLWFLWYLLLLAAGFIVLARLGVRFCHPIVWWLAIPLSLAVATLMDQPVFGADTAIGMIPDPVVLAYFALFFAFGAFMYQRGVSVRRWWMAALIPAAGSYAIAAHLLERYLDGLAGAELPDAFLFEHSLTMGAAVLEVAFAWLASFGLMGLFHWLAAKERFWIRYMSDASYWMYLVHLPLVIAGQLLVVRSPVHYHLKYLLVCAVVTLVLLVTYQWGVRYTVIGRMLNGPRTRRQSALTGSR